MRIENDELKLKIETLQSQQKTEDSKNQISNIELSNQLKIL